MMKTATRRIALLAGAPLGALGLALPAQAQVFPALSLANPAEHADGPDQLSGGGYAGYLQSFNSLGHHHVAILDRATDCEVPPLAGSALECRTAPMHLWAQADYQWRRKDGDEVAEYHADRWSALVGFDVNIGPLAAVGGSIGKVGNDVGFRDGANASVKGDGWQLGLYGIYDPGQFYVKAMTSYSNFDGDARRFTGFGGLATGEIRGDPDVRLWIFGLHAGYRVPMGPASVITPFLNYDYTSAKLKAFRESGGTGAELDVDGGSSRHGWLTAGVKLAGQLDRVVPEAELGYRHMFGDRRESLRATFVGFEDGDFDIVSATEKRGAITTALSVGGKLGPIDLRIGYEGAFNNDHAEHAGFLKLVVPLGAVADPLLPPLPPPPAPEQD